MNQDSKSGIVKEAQWKLFVFFLLPGISDTVFFEVMLLEVGICTCLLQICVTFFVKIKHNKTWAQLFTMSSLLPDECPSPLYSDTRLGPCSACSENNHWVDAASCTGCPADTQTRGPQGPTTADSCYRKCSCLNISVL